MKTNVMQIVRLVMMIVAVAGIIYALEYMERGIAVWFWITLLGVGFVGLLYTFRLTQRRVRLERRARERQEKKKTPPVETLTFIRRTSLPGGSVSGRRLAVSDGAVFPGRQFYSGRAGLFPAAGFRCLGRRQVRGRRGVRAWDGCRTLRRRNRLLALKPLPGRGMMTAAVRQAVEWMFANTPVIRIFAAAYATNSASQRVLVKTGFRHVGTFRKAFFKNGAFVDGCYYELLKDENE